MYDSGEVEDVDHFLIGCTESGKGRKVLLEELRGAEGDGEWLEEFERVGTEEKIVTILVACIYVHSIKIRESISKQSNTFIQTVKSAIQ